MNAEQFKITVLPVKDKLYRLALRMLREPADAQDAIQEVLLKIWRQGTALKKIDNIEAWAMRVTKNHCLDRLRSRRRQIQALEPYQLDADDHPSAQEKLEQRETVHQLKQLMQRLPEKQQLVLQLRDVEGMTYQEIEELLDMPLGQVKTNLFRARQKMKKLLLAIASEK
jgi:RNA polymerase sigma-70 factor (ECF subfamily)